MEKPKIKESIERILMSEATLDKEHPFTAIPRGHHLANEYYARKIYELHKSEMKRVLEELRYKSEEDIINVHTQCACNFNKRIDEAIKREVGE